MIDPQHHGAKIAVHDVRLDSMDTTLKEISQTLKELKNLELHHAESRNSIANLGARCERVERLIDSMDKRLDAIEGVERSRTGAMKAIGFIWAAVGGLIVVELWRFFGGHP